MAPAFTLIEVLIAILLLTVLAAIAWPNFSANRQAEQLAESTRRFRTLVAMCRAEAMNTARTYRIAFRRDGSIDVRRQLDPVYAPNVYLPIPDPWASVEILGEGVWVESITPLTSGPDAMEIEDDELVQLTAFVEEQEEAARRPVGDLEAEWPLEFDSNGLSATMHWVLRDVRGRGVKLTLDGRLGRVSWADVEVVDPEQLERPKPVDPPDDPYAGLGEEQVLQEFLP